MLPIVLGYPPSTITKDKPTKAGVNPIVNNGFSEKPQNSSSPSGEDIPAALRDIPDSKPKGNSKSFLIIVGLAGFILLSVISGFVFFALQNQKTTETPVTNSTPTSASNETNNNQREENKDLLLGHLKYDEAPESDLAPVSVDGRWKMRSSAAQKFKEMVADARKSGVLLTPISAFRSKKEQEQLFFGVGAQKNQTPAQRAALSAPPGRSEHHTGYAVDIGDASVPLTNLEATFETTKAFEWLQANAARYGFEMSFPKNNAQGVSYEPWHWRFVGDTDSLETFYRAKNIKPLQKPGQ
jgi:zinc D-Ala-D-Ala carboxypeptidase